MAIRQTCRSTHPYNPKTRLETSQDPDDCPASAHANVLPSRSKHIIHSAPSRLNVVTVSSPGQAFSQRDTATNRQRQPIETRILLEQANRETRKQTRPWLRRGQDTLLERLSISMPDDATLISDDPTTLLDRKPPTRTNERMNERPSNETRRHSRRLEHESFNLSQKQRPDGPKKIFV
jgi:hypothetical protein